MHSPGGYKGTKRKFPFVLRCTTKLGNSFDLHFEFYSNRSGHIKQYLIKPVPFSWLGMVGWEDYYIIMAVVRRGYTYEWIPTDTA